MGKVLGKHFSIMEKSFWAYGMSAGRVVLVRCQSLPEAAEELERMKQSDATAAGRSQRRISEAAMRKYSRKRGWRVSLIRDVK